LVRATVSEVKKLFGGTLPANWTTEANVTNLCTQVDAAIDGKTTGSVSTSSAAAKQLANELVARYMMWGNWMHAGSEGEEPVIWNRDMLDRLEQLTIAPADGTAAYMKLQADS